MLNENFVKILETSIKKNWNLPSLSDYEGKSLSYGKVAENILRLHYIFHECNVKKGDKIALVGKNSVNWTVVYLATITYGAVIVPILPDFNPDDIHHIVNHSDSVLLFALDSIYENLDDEKMPHIEGIFSLGDFSVIHQKKKNLFEIWQKSENKFLAKYNNTLNPDILEFENIQNKDLAAIVYTSGTTGFSKGVLLNHNSLTANILYAQKNMPLKSGDNILSFMPLAHAYGCAFEFLFPFTLGCHVTLLGRIPSPKIIVQAFQKIRPQLILSVPLIIEKIYKKQIKPAIEKMPAKLLIKTPIFSKIINKKIKASLETAFGSNFHELVIGGAALNDEVETFLTKIGFPFTIGYGMTECGPLISYCAWNKTKMGSVGLAIDYVDVKIDSDDPENTVGEILVKGENVMLGYYKNEQATNETIDKDGWLHTGDLGVIDKDGFIYIRGRAKSMILGASGQNIYPEEVEAKINNMPYVQESLIIDRAGKIVALIYPDIELTDKEGLSESDIQAKMEQMRKEVNKDLPSYISISSIELYPAEFEKTPTKKIKRFLYTIPHAN